MPANVHVSSADQDSCHLIGAYDKLIGAFNAPSKKFASQLIGVDRERSFVNELF